MAAVCAGIAYTLGYFLFHHPRNFGFLIEGAMIGLFIGLRTLVRQQE